MRPGRLDRLIYLGISGEREHQANIIKALTRKFPLSQDFSLARVVDQCKPNFTGADMYALCSDAMLRAIKRCVDGQDPTVKPIVTTDDFEQAIAQLHPSVSLKELERYNTLAQQYATK